MEFTNIQEQESMLQKAYRYAKDIHMGQTRRRNGASAFDTHVMGVVQILRGVTNDEAIISAGYLHDTIEECVPYGSVTKDILAREFNTDIAEIVSDLTDPDTRTHSWKARKQAVLDRIPSMRKGSLLVKSADVLYNLQDTISALQENPSTAFTIFHASKSDVIKHYKKIIMILGKTWQENPLLPKLQTELASFLVLAQPHEVDIKRSSIPVVLAPSHTVA